MVGPSATAPKMHRFMIRPVQGIFAVGHPVTSGGTAAISIRLVHRPSMMNALASRAHASSCTRRAMDSATPVGN